MRRFPIFSKFIVLFILLNINCTYLIKEPGSPPKINGEAIGDNYRKIYIQNFHNNSYGPALHVMLTQLLKSEVDRRGRFIQTRDKSDATFKLYGSINHYQRVGNLLDLGNQELSSEITVICKIELQETGGERLTLERDEIMLRGYFSDQLGYRESEEQAQARLMRNMSIRISEEIESAWYEHIKTKYYPESKN
jgi:hypothetical protein